MTRFLVYDVFTDAAFGGNPLAVVPEATSLPEPLLQKVAREFNFSESVFLYPPRDPAHRARVRIFTPEREIPFAGHPTIGSAVALADEGAAGEMVLELGVGPIRAEARDGHASFRTTAPLERMAEPPQNLVAACLGLSPEAFRAQPVRASLGLPFIFVEVEADALARAVPDTAAFRELDGALPSATDLLAIYAWSRQGDTVRARMFAPLSGIHEDPATGSAAATLCRLLAGDGMLDLTIRQGVEMGRPSRIELRADPAGITVAGQAVRVMEGRLTL